MATESFHRFSPLGRGLALGSVLLSLSVMGTTAALAQPEPSPKGNTTAPILEITAPIEDINFVTEELDGGSSIAEEDERDVLTLSADVNFAKDSAKLSARANQILDQAAAKWKDKNVTSIEITGHTDSVRGRVDNTKLSKDRAAAVQKVLKKKFSGVKTTATGKGPNVPRAKEQGLKGKDLENARALNRRVEVVVSFPSK